MQHAEVSVDLQRLAVFAEDYRDEWPPDSQITLDRPLTAGADRRHDHPLHRSNECVMIGLE
ncbi:hypothetical protein [Streptomyces sp. NPDC002785]|uniref:hypothetical protein n=1 Tax=Streptomyces sp. NPDC002785 TaxID=3154543 RepID=UPI00331E56AC